MAMTAEAIAGRIHQSGFDQFAIEAGHVYIDPNFSPLKSADRAIARIGARVGGVLANSLSMVGSAKRWLFVDELNVGSETKPNSALTPQEIIDDYAGLGFRPDHVVLESNPKLHAAALSLVDRIARVSPNRLVVTRQYYHLKTDDDRPNVALSNRTRKREGISGVPVDPKCSLIDAALTLYQMEHMNLGSGASITVLPDVGAYREQQANTISILEAAGYGDLPRMSVFYATQPAPEQSPDLDYRANF